MKEDLHIVHVSAHPGWRGGEQQLSYVLSELSNFPCQRLLFCSRNHAMHSYAIQHKIPYKLFNSSPFLWLYSAWQLHRICRKKNVHIIHAHDAKAHTLVFLSFLLGNRTPSIISRRVDFPIQKNLFSKWKYNNNGIAKYICVSDKVREVLIKDLADKSKAVTIHSGIDKNRFNPDLKSAILRKQFNIPPFKFLAGNVASLADHKDYFTFVDTAEHVLRQCKDIQFLIIGDGPLHQQVTRYIQSKGLEKDIILTGFRSDIDQILPELDVLLFTSKTEGLGTSILDAMACGVPVVSTNAGGIPEIVSHGDNGLMASVGDSVTLANHVLEIIRNVSLKENLIKAGFDTVNSFSKEEMSKKTYEMYLRIGNRKK